MVKEPRPVLHETLHDPKEFMKTPLYLAEDGSLTKTPTKTFAEIYTSKPPTAGETE